MLILYVDDDSDDGEIFADAVKEVNSKISCLLFESGQELLNFLNTTTALPDYIFIDINMPRMNGYECADAIKSNERFNQIQLIMYSTAFKPKDVEEYTKSGIKFLEKSSKVADLVQSITMLLTSPA